MKMRGFTLVELLIVIAIICILAAILFPVFAAAREKSRQSACQSNLHQIGLAWLQYCQDYDEMTPNVCYGYSCNTWGSMVSAGLGPNGGDTHFDGATTYTNGHGSGPGMLLSPYLKSDAVWFCPGNPTISAQVVWDPTSGTCGKAPADECYAGGFENSSYQYNFQQFVCAANAGSSGKALPAATAGLELSQLTTPDTVAVFFGSWGNSGGFGWATLNAANACDLESADGGIYCSVQYPLSSGVNFSYSQSQKTGHSMGGNAMFADGHVKWYSQGWINTQIEIEHAAGICSGGSTRAPGSNPTIFHD